MSEKLQNQIIYLASVDLLRRLLERGEISMDIVERLNKRNAERMGCPVVFL